MGLVVEFHVHLGLYHDLRPWVMEWMKNQIPDVEELAREVLTPQGLIHYLRANGVNCVVVLAESSPITTGVVTNEAVAEFCQGMDRLIPFCNINPFLAGDLAGELDGCVTAMGFRGLKLYRTHHRFYANSSRPCPSYAKEQELRIPVMIHAGSSVFRGARLKYRDPLHLDDVAVDFPDLILLMVHSGRGFWYDRAFSLAKLHPNPYMEIAGLPPHRLLIYFPDLERAADNVIFGSDFPGMPHIGRNIDALRGLPLRSETKEKILGGNAAGILGTGIDP